MKVESNKVSRSLIARHVLMCGFVMLVAAASTGCANRLKDLEGTYYGDLSVIENNTATTRSVVATIDRNSWKAGNTLEVHVNTRGDENTPSRLVALVRLKKSGKNIVVDSTLVPSISGRSRVKIRDRGACGQEEPDNRTSPSLTMICATTDVVSLFATNLSGSYRALLYMSKNGSAAPSLNLPPEGRFTLDEVFMRVQEDSYENRLAAEKLYQAREEIKRVRSNLIPGLNVGSIVSAVIGSYNSAMGIAGLIGGFVPFIFPSHWYALSAQKATYEAEIQSYKSLVANQMNLAEDLYHGVVRDQLMLGRVRGMRSRIEATRAVIDDLVSMGLAPETDLYEYDDLLLQNDNSQSNLRHLIRAQYAALSRGLGLSPRDGIRSLVATPPPEVSALEPIDSEELMAEATATSMELKQFLFLRRAADRQKKAAQFSFLSPSGWIGFNAGIFHDVRIQKSNVHHLELLREQAERMIAEQIIVIASLHNRLIEQSTILDRQISARRRGLQTLEGRYRSGTATIIQLRASAEALMQLEAEKTDVESAMAIVLGKIDRLLMRGPYNRVLTMQVGR